MLPVEHKPDWWVQAKGEHILSNGRNTKVIVEQIANIHLNNFIDGQFKIKSNNLIPQKILLVYSLK